MRIIIVILMIVIAAPRIRNRGLQAIRTRGGTWVFIGIPNFSIAMFIITIVIITILIIMISSNISNIIISSSTTTTII